MNNHDGGKGDTPRPLGVTMEQFDKSWDEIFGKKDEAQTKDSIEIDLEVSNDEQSITVTKTWDIG